MFIDSFDVTVSRYESDLSALLSGSMPLLPNLNLDTGRRIHFGSYHLADRAYAALLDKLARQHFAGITPELRLDVLNFYGNPQAAPGNDSAAWNRIFLELASLRNLCIPATPGFRRGDRKAAGNR